MEKVTIPLFIVIICAALLIIAIWYTVMTVMQRVSSALLLMVFAGFLSRAGRSRSQAFDRY